ncbi:MAG TPA: NAD(P)-dependent oxidoreductase [Acidimicrobiaceae bacterium]|nr:NAD(P)-dependent oxidoreductase [Acidimicrobiaceae bacterium]|tara:strand:- start:1691 stop:2515 length:825 start_codon:yes stop_codon:yes gene_type:complete
MSDRLSIHGRTVCITGSSSGMGRAIAEHLGALGATVYLMGRNAEPMEESKARIEAAGGKADLATFDVADTAALQAWIQRAADETGRLDVMINNAGFGDFGTSFLGGDPDIWKGMLDVNVLALAVGSQAAVVAMRATESQGNIINISSVAAIRRDSGMYGATKHAVNCINASLRSELEDDTIRVTSIMPGVFATNFSRNVGDDMMGMIAGMAGVENVERDAEGRVSREMLAQLAANMSTTFGDVEDIARTVEFVITQPIHLNIEELVIRPAKSFI